MAFTLRFVTVLNVDIHIYILGLKAEVKARCKLLSEYSFKQRHISFQTHRYILLFLVKSQRRSTHAFPAETREKTNVLNAITIQ